MSERTVNKEAVEDAFIRVGDLIEIHKSFIDISGFKIGLVIKHYRVAPPPSTTMKRSVAEILKPDGTISRIPYSFIKKVYRGK
jgi:hypothetical protein